MREHYSNMSLPPGFLEELRNRSSLSQVVGRKVTWEQKKTNISKGDYWAPCPFHSEKTASFHVDDKKGFYYCFGCHEKGDAISFIRNSENVSFIEAVEILAREAGMTMPTRDPKAQEKIDINKVNIFLKKNKFSTVCLHGDMNQSARINSLEEFKSGLAKILVASDVAARGLDIAGLSHVFNYDVPNNPEDYIHRIGRTGRAGLSGKAFTLCSEKEIKSLTLIELSLIHI